MSLIGFASRKLGIMSDIAIKPSETSDLLDEITFH
jgi:hypothetical protein